MCHGVFDLVHPGHIRHLLYAKEKADILVASLTADAHITKAQYRPFVPQDLRALNLAALEMVDYVVIDPNPTPIENIERHAARLFRQGLRIRRERHQSQDPAGDRRRCTAMAAKFSSRRATSSIRRRT